MRENKWGKALRILMIVIICAACLIPFYVLLVLSLNAGAQSLPVAADGAFTFPTGLANGASYAVTVGTQPTGQTCSVASGSGTISGANVTNVAVSCAAIPTYTVGGTAEASDLFGLFDDTVQRLLKAL